MIQLNDCGLAFLNPCLISLQQFRFGEQFLLFEHQVQFRLVFMPDVIELVQRDVPAAELLVCPRAPRYLYYLLFVFTLLRHSQSVLEGAFWEIFKRVYGIFFPEDQMVLLCDAD